MSRPPLSPRHRRLLRSLVPIVCPPEAEALGVVDAVVDHCELSVGAFPPPVRAALRLGLATYDLSAAAWPPARGRTAARLPRERAAAWFALWWKSPLPPQRELARAIKAMMAIAYYEMPAVKRELGYLPEEWIERVKTRRLKVYADEIRRHDESLIAPDPLPPRAAGKGAEPAAAVTPLAARRAPGKAQGGAA
ncbi:MAG TPA: hypothetical protein VKZ63_01185 [Kofleriaceae bacterium]|nr:hypothetical protein [Kofleriaceae bacterium]